MNLSLAKLGIALALTMMLGVTAGCGSSDISESFSATKEGNVVDVALGNVVTITCKEPVTILSVTVNRDTANLMRVAKSQWLYELGGVVSLVPASSKEETQESAECKIGNKLIVAGANIVELTITAKEGTATFTW